MTEDGSWVKLVISLEGILKAALIVFTDGLDCAGLENGQGQL